MKTAVLLFAGLVLTAQVEDFAFAQLPASGTLRDSDRPAFRAELARIDKLLAAAPEKATMTYVMARTYASAKQWPQTIEWLRKAVDLHAGLNPSRDSIFADLRGTKEFAALIEAAREAPLSTSRAAFTIREGDLAPESVAYDARRQRFYFGSMRKNKVVRCSPSGDCAPFATGLGEVLGLKVHGDGLWLLNNSKAESSLMHYDLSSASLVRKYSVAGSGHEFNDLAIAPSGDLYLTDTRAGAVWMLSNGSTELKRVPGKFQFANGIALSADAGLLYVSTFPDGITVVDLKSATLAPIARPANLCLLSIDGLYVHRGDLIAIQNGVMSPRVVRMTVSRDLRTIERFEILERGNPLFDGVTTGVIADDDFFYMANIQDEKKGGFDPIMILKLHL